MINTRGLSVEKGFNQQETSGFYIPNLIKGLGETHLYRVFTLGKYRVHPNRSFYADSGGLMVCEPFSPK